MLYYMMLPEQYSQEDYRQLYDRIRPLLPDFRRKKGDAILPARERVCSALAYLLLCYGLKEEYPADLAGACPSRPPFLPLPEFAWDENRKPMLTGSLSHIHFNMSHCSAAVACALSGAPVGVDVQEPRPVREALVRRFFPERSKEPEKTNRDPREDFIPFWSRYEAYAKLTGRGLSLSVEDCGFLSEDYLRENHILLHTYPLVSEPEQGSSPAGYTSPAEWPHSPLPAQKKTAAYLSAASFDPSFQPAPKRVEFTEFLNLFLFPLSQ